MLFSLYLTPISSMFANRRSGYMIIPDLAMIMITNMADLVPPSSRSCSSLWPYWQVSQTCCFEREMVCLVEKSIYKKPLAQRIEHCSANRRTTVSNTAVSRFVGYYSGKYIRVVCATSTKDTLSI